MSRWSSIAYYRLGGFFILSALPGWVFLGMGRLLQSRNPHLLLSLAGLPLGILFILFGRDILPRNSKSDIGARIGFLGACFVALAYLSWAAVQGGVPLLMTSVLFCSMTASYLSLLAFGFLVAAWVGRKQPEDA